MANITFAQFQAGTFSDLDTLIDGSSNPIRTTRKDASGDRLEPLASASGMNVSGQLVNEALNAGTLPTTGYDSKDWFITAVSGGIYNVGDIGVWNGSGFDRVAAPASAGKPTTISNVAAIATIRRSDMGSDYVDLKTFSDESNGRGGSDLVYTGASGTENGTTTFEDIDGMIWERRRTVIEPEQYAAFDDGAGQPSSADCAVQFQAFLEDWQTGRIRGEVQGGNYACGTKLTITQDTDNDLIFGSDTRILVAYAVNQTGLEIRAGANQIKLFGRIKINVHKLTAGDLLYGGAPRWFISGLIDPAARWENDDTVRTDVCQAIDKGILVDGIRCNDMTLSAENFGVNVHCRSSQTNGMQLAKLNIHNSASGKVNLLVSSKRVGGIGFVNQNHFTLTGFCGFRGFTGAESAYCVAQCSDIDGTEWYSGNCNTYSMNAAEITGVGTHDANTEVVGFLADGAFECKVEGMRLEQTTQTKNSPNPPSLVGQLYGMKVVYRNNSLEQSTNNIFRYFPVALTTNKVFENNGMDNKALSISKTLEPIVFKHSIGEFEKNAHRSANTIAVKECFFYSIAGDTPAPRSGAGDWTLVDGKLSSSSTNGLAFDLLLPNTYDMGTIVSIERLAANQGRMVFVAYDVAGAVIDLGAAARRILTSTNRANPLSISAGPPSNASEPNDSQNTMIIGVHQDVKRLRCVIVDGTSPVTDLERIDIKVENCKGASITSPVITGEISGTPVSGDYPRGADINSTDGNKYLVSGGAVATPYVASTPSVIGEWIHNSLGTSGSGYGIYESDGSNHPGTEPTHTSGTVDGMTYLFQRDSVKTF